MSESWRTRFFRWFFNLYPAYRGTGGWITYIHRDFEEVRAKVPLSWRTRNYVGTIFGGSLYGAVDPVYMIMLIKRLGSDYVVWDKAASIRFKKPGRDTLYASFRVDDEEVDEIRKLLRSGGSVDRHYTVELTDDEGTVHALVEKTVHVRRESESLRDGGAPASSPSADDRGLREEGST